MEIDVNPWTAPEVLEQKAFSKKSDIYSFGIGNNLQSFNQQLIEGSFSTVLWEILTNGEVPFKEFDIGKLEAAIKSGVRPPVPGEPVFFLSFFFSTPLFFRKCTK
jgi:serine/threonine protein kinase